LAGWAQLHLGDVHGATAAWEQVARDPHSPSAVYAKALLGRIHFQRGAYEEAVAWWSSLDAEQRTAWKLDETLGQTVFLTGLLTLQQGQFEQAADRFREAGRLGVRDRRLGTLLIHALVQAGQQRLSQNDECRTRNDERKDQQRDRSSFLVPRSSFHEAACLF